MNIEHLLDVFTSIDMNALDVWEACVRFMDHLYWQKPRQIVLRSKIEGLPDGHPSKADCLFGLALLFGSIGSEGEQKRLLIQTLTLDRERGDDRQVALTLGLLSHVNLILGLHREEIQQVEEAFKTYERLGDTPGQATCLDVLAWLLLHDDQLDAAEAAALRNINLLPEKGEEFRLCQSHQLLGEIYRSKGEKEKAVDHFKTALIIASPFNWQGERFWIHYALAKLFCNEREFNDAHIHIEQAKSHTADDAYKLGRGMEMQAWIWYWQYRLEDARCEASGALKIYEKLEAVKDTGDCGSLIQQIENAMRSRISGESDSGFLATILFPANSFPPQFSVRLIGKPLRC